MTCQHKCFHWQRHLIPALPSSIIIWPWPEMSCSVHVSLLLKWTVLFCRCVFSHHLQAVYWGELYGSVLGPQRTLCLCKQGEQRWQPMMGALESERMDTNTQSLVSWKQQQTHPTSKSINGFQTGKSCCKVCGFTANKAEDDWFPILAHCKGAVWCHAEAVGCYQAHIHSTSRHSPHQHWIFTLSASRNCRLIISKTLVSLHRRAVW